MKKIIAFIQEHVLIVLLFFLLTIGLFLGDGKQAIVDVFGAVGTLCLVVVATLFLKRQRGIPFSQMVCWWGLLIYLGIRTFFSDDVGYSIYSFLRYIETFVLYYIFISYSKKNSIHIFLNALLVFSLVVFVCTVPFAFKHLSPSFLPPMNLLYLNYGHNHAADIFLLAFPAAVVLWHTTRQRKYLWCGAIIIVGTILSFARTVLFLEAIFITAAVAYEYFVTKNVNKNVIVLNALLLLVALVITIIPYSRLATVSVIFPKFMKPALSLEMRAEYWRQAVVSIRERPMFGAGPGTFFLQSRRLQQAPNEYSWFAHNFLLEYVSETGIAGLILLILLLGVLTRGCIQNKFRWESAALISVLILAILQSFMDYNLDYLIIWFLVSVALGMLCSQAHGPKIGRTPLLFVSAVVMLVIFYATNLCLFYATNGIKNTTVYQLICAYDLTCTRLLLSPNGNKSVPLPPKFYLYAQFFHKKNPDTAAQLAQYFHSRQEDKNSYNEYFFSVSMDPQNSVTAEEYATLLITNKQYDYLLPFEELLTKSISKNVTQDSNFLKTHWHVLYPCFDNNALLWPQHQQVYSYQAKSLYYAGLCLIKKNNFDDARELLRIAVDAREGWSNIYLDYAGLSEWVYHDTGEARRAVALCKENINSKRHCISYDNRLLPKNSLTDEKAVFTSQ